MKAGKKKQTRKYRTKQIKGKKEKHREGKWVQGRRGPIRSPVIDWRGGNSE